MKGDCAVRCGAVVLCESLLCMRLIVTLNNFNAGMCRCGVCVSRVECCCWSLSLCLGIEVVVMLERNCNTIARSNGAEQLKM